MVFATEMPPGRGSGHGKIPRLRRRQASNMGDAARVSKARAIGRAILRYLGLVSTDLLFMALFAGLMGALAYVHTFKNRSHLFPMWIDPSTRLWVGPVEYSYLYVPFILSTVHAALVDIFVPIAVVLFMQLFIRSFWDANAAIFALLKALIVITLLQQILKQYVGGLRPYFLTVCQPNEAVLNTLLEALPTASTLTPGYHRLFVDISICTTSVETLEFHYLALASFPSGHAGNAFAAGTLLALYLNAKLKAFSDYHTSFWKQIAVLAPLIGASLIAGNLLLDHHHHVSDILAGIALGTLAALLSYRAHYAALFDYRYNHIPLPYSGTHKSFLYNGNAYDGTGIDSADNAFAPYLIGPKGRVRDVAVEWPRGAGTTGSPGRGETSGNGVETGVGTDGAVPVTGGMDGSMGADRPVRVGGSRGSAGLHASTSLRESAEAIVGVEGVAHVNETRPGSLRWV